MNSTELLWLAVGLGGQLLFALRVLIQWWTSEKAGRSVVPAAYWGLGLLGACCLLVYGCYRRDPVIILGQLFGSLVSCRNLVLLRREHLKSIPKNKLWTKSSGTPLPSRP